ncbi:MULTISPECIES: exonuclease SbcCD subunit D [unclassified Frankia]
MRALHTSDWHLGRGLYGHDLMPAQAAFVDHLVNVVRSEGVDVVLIAGDVHDRAIPPVGALELFDESLSRLRGAGARVVVISGNHDAARRLGDKAGLLDPRVRIRTDPAAVGDPVVVEDPAGAVRVYAIPYLEPSAANSQLPEPAQAPSGSGAPAAGLPAATMHRAMHRAMHAVRADLARYPAARSVVVAHAWVTGGAASESERDISVGGVGNVPAQLFEGITYTALGHLHRPQAIAPSVRYSGSPLAYSFSESGDAKASLLVEIGPTGLGNVTRIGVPARRRMALLRGSLADLLTDPAHTPHEADFVSAVLTDPIRPMDAMARLQRRFPFALRLAHEPETEPDEMLSFGRRTRGRSELEIAEAFVAHVRSAPSVRERALLAEALGAARRAEEEVA